MGGYWSFSCVTDDDRYLAAAGDHAALIDLTSGKSVERLSGMIKALGCTRSQVIVVGYDHSWTLPGKTEAPAPVLSGDVIGLSPKSEWISVGRKTVGGKWKGPPTLFVAAGGTKQQTDLPPQRFGAIGVARERPTADSFAVRFGNLIEDGRLVVSAGWEPSASAGTFEEVPWGFFAIDLHSGEATPLTLPLKSDPGLNQHWLQKLAATPDGMHLAIAAHDGQSVTVAQFDQGANVASRTTRQPSKGSVSAVAISDDGSFVAIGTETRGSDAPAQAWVVNLAGKTIWTSPFQKTVIGLHFLGDNSLIVAAAEAKAVRVALPAGVETWRTP